jgi:hypothetical protein
VYEKKRGNTGVAAKLLVKFLFVYLFQQLVICYSFFEVFAVPLARHLTATEMNSWLLLCRSNAAADNSMRRRLTVVTWGLRKMREHQQRKK